MHQSSASTDQSGIALLDSLALAFASRRVPSDSLIATFLTAHSRIDAAPSWNDVFGKLPTLRERKKMAFKRIVHFVAIELAVASPELPINRDFFEQVGEDSRVNRPGSSCESVYYVAVSEGALSVHEARLKPR